MIAYWKPLSSTRLILFPPFPIRLQPWEIAEGQGGFVACPFLSGLLVVLI